MPSDAMYGNLNLLILRVLAAGGAHGLAIKEALESATSGELSVEPGALYPALHRLQRDGLVTADWGCPPEVAGPRSTSSPTRAAGRWSGS